MQKLYLVTWQVDIEANNRREAAEKALAIQRNPDSTATVFKVEEPRGVGIRSDPRTIDLTPEAGDLAVREAPPSPNALRLRAAAQTTLDGFKQEGRTGKEREDRAARRVYQLARYAEFMDELLPGVTLASPNGSGTVTWEATAYRALQRIARGR